PPDQPERTPCGRTPSGHTIAPARGETQRRLLIRMSTDLWTTGPDLCTGLWTTWGSPPGLPRGCTLTSTDAVPILWRKNSWAACPPRPVDARLTSVTDG